MEGRVLPESTNFFFRNFPERCSVEVIRRKFEAAGRVVDIFIPAKNDKWGKKFGFVRFSGKVDEEKVLEKLNQTWIGSYIIRAYLPRFDRPTLKKINGLERREGRNRGRQPPALDIRFDGRRIAGVSYAKVLKGASGASKVQGKGPKSEEGDYEMNFQSFEVERGWLNGAFTGRLRDEFQWEEYGEELQSECSGYLKLTNMGNRMLLIKSEVGRETTEVIKEFDEWSPYWLEWWKPWEYTDANQSRVVWTRWFGVPLQAWSQRFFGLACSKFGNLMELHEVTKNKKRLDEAFVRVSTGLQSVDRIMSCRIDGACFKIRIEEIKIVDKAVYLKQVVESEFESDAESSDVEQWAGSDSIKAALEGLSEPEGEGGESVNGGEAEHWQTPKDAKAEVVRVLGNEKSAANNGVVECFEKSLGSEAGVGLDLLMNIESNPREGGESGGR